MGYPKHHLLAFGGPFGEDEQWSCSLRMTSATIAAAPDALVDATADDQVDQFAANVQQFMIDAGGFWMKPARLGYVKVNGIGSDGKYIGSETHQKIWDVPWSRTDTNSTGPFQISTAITLRTDSRRGLASHGRFFVPTAVPTIDQNGYVTGSFQNIWATAAVNLIKALNNDVGPDAPGTPDVCVVSRGKNLGNNNWGEGKWNRVTSVEVGNVLDTQRRRRRSLREVRYAQVLA
jgi:hypothetical protein